MRQQLAARGAGLVEILANRLDLDHDARQFVRLFADQQRGLSVHASRHGDEVERRPAEGGEPPRKHRPLEAHELADATEHSPSSGVG
jgi:hypothetical protein